MAIPATLVWCQTQNGIAFRTIHPCLPLLLTLPNRHARHQCCGCCRLVDPPFRAPSHVDKRVSVPLSPLHPAGVPWFWSWQRSWLCSSRKYCRLHEGVTHCHSNAFSSSSFVVVDSFAPKLDFLSSSVVTLFVPCLRVGYRLTCLFVVLNRPFHPRCFFSVLVLVFCQVVQEQNYADVTIDTPTSSSYERQTVTDTSC